jgi:hypothetical protein
VTTTCRGYAGARLVPPDEGDENGEPPPLVATEPSRECDDAAMSDPRSSSTCTIAGILETIVEVTGSADDLVCAEELARAVGCTDPRARAVRAPPQRRNHGAPSPRRHLLLAPAHDCRSLMTY